jgi:hypothetical protein
MALPALSPRPDLSARGPSYTNTNTNTDNDNESVAVSLATTALPSDVNNDIVASDDITTSNDAPVSSINETPTTDENTSRPTTSISNMNGTNGNSVEERAKKTSRPASSNILANNNSSVAASSSRPVTSKTNDSSASAAITVVAPPSRPATSKGNNGDTEAVASQSRPVSSGKRTDGDNGLDGMENMDAKEFVAEMLARPATTKSNTATVVAPTNTSSSRPVTANKVESVSLPSRPVTTSSSIPALPVSMYTGVRGLRRADLLTPSNPLVRVLVDGTFVAQTECIMNKAEHDFTSSLPLLLAANDIKRRTTQRIRFMVYDLEDEKVEPNEKQLIGYVQLTTDHLLGQPFPVCIPLEAPHDDAPARGLLRLTIDDTVIANDAHINGNGELVTDGLTISATGLTNKTDMTSIVVVYQQRMGRFIEVGRTELIRYFSLFPPSPGFSQ